MSEREVDACADRSAKQIISEFNDRTVNGVVTVDIMSNGTSIGNEEGEVTGVDVTNWAEAIFAEDSGTPGRDTTSLPGGAGELQKTTYANAVASSSSGREQYYAEYLPEGYDWANYALIHCTTKIRPIYESEVLDAISKKFDVRKVRAIAHFRSNDTFMVKLESLEAQAKFLQLRDLQIGNAPVDILSPQVGQVKLILVNIPEVIKQQEVIDALKAWGEVQHQSQLCSPDKRYSHVLIDRRKVVLKLKKNIVVDTIPQVITISTFRIPIIVLGRPVRCYMCHGVGHFRQQCHLLKEPIRREDSASQLRKVLDAPVQALEIHPSPTRKEVRGDSSDVPPVGSDVTKPAELAVSAAELITAGEACHTIVPVNTENSVRCDTIAAPLQDDEFIVRQTVRKNKKKVKEAATQRDRSPFVPSTHGQQPVEPGVRLDSYTASRRNSTRGEGKIVLVPRTRSASGTR